LVPDGVFVYTTFKGAAPVISAEIHAEARVRNTRERDFNGNVTYQVTDVYGKVVAEGAQPLRLTAASIGRATVVLPIASPALWTPETPTLYHLTTTLEATNEVMDEVKTAFGVRTAAFDPDKGFLLNGKPYELKGTCNHQDHAGVGAALPDHVQSFRIARLKEMGDNAYRTSHNPPTPELLEACDRLGMLVMDENRLLGSDAANLDRLERLVRRDRSHPSVVVWSIANEEDVQTTPTGGRVAETMQRLIHRLDPSRQVTMDYHAAHPKQPNVGTEQASTVCTRGVYANDKERGYVSAYDDNAPPWAHTTETWWKFFADRPWLSGGFAWTGFDYRGEPTPYGWPCINSHFGIVDTCGFPKDNFYYYQAWWGKRPMLHLLPHWDWPGKEGQEIDVRCFSNCEEVELFLNGNSLGKKPMERNSHLAWKVKYAPGALSAKGFRAGKVLAEDKVETTGAPAAIKLTPDRPAINANGEDVSILTVAVTDARGRVVPVAGNLVNFELTGPGRILGVGNGDPSSHEADVYFSKPVVRTAPLNEWLMKEVESVQNSPEIAAEVDEGAWSPADVRAESGPLKPGKCAVFRAHYRTTAEDLSTTNILLNIGMIDDEGWVYINGQLAGESHDWSSSPSFAVGRFLIQGDNTIAIAVKNNADSGGLNKGVVLEFVTKPSPANWKRSVFNGLAQIIVQGTKEAGELKLTASSNGLKPATLGIQTKPCAPRPFAP